MTTGKNSERKTKIVATLGPASETPGIIEDLIKAGVNVFRLNFSHGTHPWQRQIIETVRKKSRSLSIPVALMQDLQGPRLRTGRLKAGKPVELTSGKPVCITPGDFQGTATHIATDYRSLHADVRSGARIMLSDGLIELEVREVSGKDVHCRVVSGGLLRENQGINLPGSDLSATPPTEKDIADLKLGIECGVDYVAMSFVSRAGELMKLREEISRLTDSAPPAIVAKIERPQAVNNIDSIIEAADGVMVARGDLGIEMNPEEVPAVQKHIIRSANRCALPVITATQMLDSMIGNPRPTRAETSDVANAILDGSDAVMLSGETAIGRHPVHTVEMMAKIAKGIEPELRNLLKESRRIDRPSGPAGHTPALAAAACRVADEVGARAIAAFTMTGATARFVAQQRTSVPVYAMTPDEMTCRQLSMVWGVIPVAFPLLDSTDDMISVGKEKMLDDGVAGQGDTVVCVAGPSTRTPGGADILKLLRF